MEPVFLVSSAVFPDRLKSRFTDSHAYSICAYKWWNLFLNKSDVLIQKALNVYEFSYTFRGFWIKTSELS